MRLIGFKQGSRTMIAVRVSDGGLSPLTDADTFYDDLDHWLPEARSRNTGDKAMAAISETPAIRAGARIFCVGLNYHDHATEVGRELPPHPTLFGRWAASLVASGVPVPLTDERLDWEGEVAAVIGTRTWRVSAEEARHASFAYAVFNDISARTYQRHTSQWTLGKNADCSGPMGPLVSADEVGDLSDGLLLTTRVNGKLMQQASTATMIHRLENVIAYISELVTLLPGDVIATGTPGGVGMARQPPEYLKAGDVVDVEVEKLGIIVNPIVASS